MPRTEFISTGYYVPERVVTNLELEDYMDTSDDWIRKRSGIEERRWCKEGQGGSDMAKVATERALEKAGMEADEIDCIVVATISPDYFFPGTGVFLQRKLGLSEIPCFDLRNQCSGFLYALQVADAFIRLGQYRRILLVGTEIHSTGLQVNDVGRDTAVLFGDGAGVAILGPTDDEERGVLAVRTHADGNFAEKLWAPAPACIKNPFISHQDIDDMLVRPFMTGKEVFRHAVTRMPEAIHEVLDEAGLTLDQIDMVIPHQANLRISEMVQRRLGLSDDKIYNNIMRYGNTTAASIPIALSEAVDEGKIERGDLVAFTAFGSGFTWGGALVRW
ncbi:MAG: ketoacyl-ACP synthase III [Gemmatimonadetes bacterium]|nr:ketoacyl-ACP synthase III [Gemmatimonadota bacterium]